MFSKKNQFFLFFCSLSLIAGCTSAPSLPPVSLPEPLRPPMQDAQIVTATFEEQQGATEQRTRFQRTPGSPVMSSSTSARLDKTTDSTPQFTNIAPLQVNIEGLPLPAFINEVFGNLLDISFEIAPEIQNKRELVTLRVNEKQRPEQLYRLAIQVLTNYGVEIQIQGNLLRFIAASSQTPPPSFVVTGLTLPEVPPTHRPIFQLIPLKMINAINIISWLQTLFQGHDVKILQDTLRNAIVLIGTPQLVTQAAKVIEILDQPLMQGQHSLRIEPAFLSAQELATQLTNVLKNQGFGIPSGITLLPIPSTNAVIAFAPDAKTLAHIQQWAEQLDHVNLQDTEKESLFFYPVKNTSAESLSTTLNELLGQAVITPPTAAPITGTTAAGASPLSSPTVQPRVRKLAIDEHRNGLLFFGTGAEWARLIPILRDMDKPPKQVLIEATIAEITLSDEDERGVSWVISNAKLGRFDGRLGTLSSGQGGGLAVGARGLTYTLSSAAEVRAVLNAFTSSNRATILSTPRLMVRSGSEASIDVGNEVPTLTSQATAADVQQEGSSAFLQQIQYRRTGILLNIKPIVYAGRRVDLQITQQVSEARPNASSNIGSPEIFNRQITTTLSLNDGHSVLLGGLISTNTSEGWSGIPILSQIPIIGQLFRVNKVTKDRTELVIMIIPYVIDNEEEAQGITDAVKRKLELLPLLIPPLPSEKPMNKQPTEQIAPF